MLQFLINVLTPVFENMGVSPTDVEQYLVAIFTRSWLCL